MDLLKLIDDIEKTQNLWMQPCASALLKTPLVDFYPVENGVELKADLPGLAKEDISVTLEDNNLVLKAERKEEVEYKDKAAKFYHLERRFGKFSRTFRLPFVAKSEDVVAKYDNGVLTVNVAKPESASAGQILIQ